MSACQRSTSARTFDTGADEVAESAEEIQPTATSVPPTATATEEQPVEATATATREPVEVTGEGAASDALEEPVGESAGTAAGDEFALPQELVSVPGVPAGDTRYVVIPDNMSAVSVALPATWAGFDTVPVDRQGIMSPSLIASSDLAAYRDWGTAGLDISVFSPEGYATVDAVLNLVTLEQARRCIFAGRHSYDQRGLIGLYDTYIRCDAESGPSFAVLAAAPEDGSYIVVARSLIQTDADLEIAAHAWTSLAVYPEQLVGQ